jgi:tetratricopeptide (TPR) repeat protein
MMEDNPYRARGALIGQSYIERDADKQLQKAIIDNNKYPYFLAPRQSGKSSVMERTKRLLSTEYIKIIIIDLSGFSKKDRSNFGRFTFIFMANVYKELNIDEKSQSRLKQLKREPFFLREAIEFLLHSIKGRIVICIDEIDVLFACKFKDDFLSQIRAFFNLRPNPIFERIQFILAGAGSQEALISDSNRSPFNVGEEIILRDLNKEQIKKLVLVGEWLSTAEAELASEMIKYWANGSVFLSQSILERLYAVKHKIAGPKGISGLIDEIVAEIISSAGHEIHFTNIKRQLEENHFLLLALNDWINGKVPDKIIKDRLILAGISNEEEPIRNRIYERVFFEEGNLSFRLEDEEKSESLTPINPVEEQLINAISDIDLQNNINNLRKAVDTIWMQSTKLSQGYTNHAMMHSGRIADNIVRLLSMNEKTQLSEKELYLLIASIYLHDIGMKCDIKKFIEIKRLAEQMGARFNIEFKDDVIDKYDDNEKKAILENHQYLSAAWIRYAFQSQKTLLGNAASKIPASLVSDLMEICKFHSKLPISSCGMVSLNDPTVRVQYIAALLRFADELDMERNRASFNRMEALRLDPYNAIYMWLHNLTVITYPSPNVVVLRITLNKEDKIKYGKLIYDKFIIEFQTINYPTITILRQNGIPIAMSAESGIIEDLNADPLPEDIKDSLNKIANKSDQANILAYEVRTWLRALSYETSDIILIDTDAAELEASIDLGASSQKLLVVCYNRELRIYDIDDISNRITIDTPSGLLISNKKISMKVSNYASTKRNIRIFYINDFLQQRIWGSYFNSLRSLVEMESIQKLYIDLGCYQEHVRDDSEVIKKYQSLDNFIDIWLRELGKTHISLLGDFGTGKTWFCRHYAYRQLTKYLEDPINERMPLLITLREFSKATTAKQLINDALIEQYKLPFKGSAFDVFKDLNRRGKLLLILDGFDEMARKVDYQTVVDNFWELAELIDNNSKVILTSRTEYFRLANESEKILSGETYGRKTIELSPPKFEILYIDKLSDYQIRELILLRRGTKDGAKDVDIILSKPNLAEMARRPVLIELLLAALDEVGKTQNNIPQNISQVYLYATNKLILRNITTERTFTSTADKLYFLCELAWEMIKNNNLSIHFSAIPDVIIRYFGDKIKGKGDLDNWDYDLRSCTFLHRDAKGNYGFAHKSLAEFFVAFKFSAELGCLPKTFKQMYLEVNLIPAEIPYRLKNITDLAETFGALSLLAPDLATVRDFLMNMIAEDAPGTLWRIIDESSDKPLNKVKFCGGNAAIMLQDIGIWKPSPYKDITDLLEQISIPQEHIYPPSPAKKDWLERALLTLGYDVKNDKFKRKQFDDPSNYALRAYNLLKEGKLGEACDIVEGHKANYPKLKDFYICLMAYAGIQSLYLGNLHEAEQYFINFEKAGGNRNWSGLKINEVHLYSVIYKCITGIGSELIHDIRSNVRKILQNSIEIGDTSNEGKSLLFLGILDRLEHRYNDSINNLRKAKELFIRECDFSRVGVSSANIAYTYRLMGNYDGAISNYDTAIENFGAVKDTYKEACARARRGSAYRALRDFDKAIEDYRAAISIFETQDEFRKSIVLKELGTTYLILGQWNEAINNYNLALAYYNSQHIKYINVANSRKGQILYNLGLAYLMQTKWEGSLEHFRKALEIFQEIQDSYNISLALSSIGMALRMMNIHSGALEYLNEALNVVVKNIHDKNRECMLITQISEIYLKMHNYDQALNEYNHALGIAEELKDDRLRGNVLGQIGITYRSMNNLAKAETNLGQSLQIFKGLGDMAKVSWMLEELGQVYIKQGFYDKAIQEYNDALKYLGTGDKALLDENLVNLVEGYVLEAIHKGEIKKYRAALNEIEKFGALGLRCKILRNLGEAYRINGKYNDAIICLNESLEISSVIDDKTQEGKTLSYLGLTFADLAQSSQGADTTSYDVSSILKLDESLKIFRNIGDRFLEVWALENQAEVYLKRGSWKRALENYIKALELESEQDSGLIHLGLATCYRNLSERALFKDECKLAHKLLSIEGMNEYTLACLEAICGTVEKSIGLLEIALTKKQASIKLISQDPFLRGIQEHPRYKELQMKYEYVDTEMILFM